MNIKDKKCLSEIVCLCAKFESSIVVEKDWKEDNSDKRKHPYSWKHSLEE